MNSIQQAADLLESSETNLVANQVASQPFIHSVLSRLDTYTLLGQTVSETSGRFSGVYSATAPLIVNALQTGSSHSGPNAPERVPGLRLLTGLADNHNFPNSHTDSLLYELRVAVARSVFTLSDTQASLVSQGFSQFLNQVNALNQEGAFTPSVPPAASPLPRGPLYGTLFVSLGSLRNLASVDSTLSGLQLPGVGNFAGRIDVGFVIDRQGNFGIAPYRPRPTPGAPKGVASANVIAGDIRIQVSNARNLNELNGLTTVEAITQGAALSGEIETSRLPNGVPDVRNFHRLRFRPRVRHRNGIYPGYPTRKPLCIDPGVSKTELNVERRKVRLRPARRPINDDGRSFGRGDHWAARADHRPEIVPISRTESTAAIARGPGRAATTAGRAEPMIPPAFPLRMTT